MYFFLRGIGFQQHPIGDILETIKDDYNLRYIQTVWNKFERASLLSIEELKIIGLSIIFSEFDLIKEEHFLCSVFRSIIRSLDRIPKDSIEEDFFTKVYSCIAMTDTSCYEFFNEKTKHTIQYKFINSFYLYWLDEVSLVDERMEDFSTQLKEELEATTAHILANEDDSKENIARQSEIIKENWCQDLIKDINIIEKYFPHKKEGCQRVIKFIADKFNVFAGKDKDAMDLIEL